MKQTAMRVISGTAKGSKLFSPGNDSIRPTSDRIKEDIFNILYEKIVDCMFLDLFAGSGAIGIEALSRGAKFCAFVDNDIKSTALIRKNLQKTRLSDYNIIVSNAEDALKSFGEKPSKFDVVYADPPYEQGFVSQILPVIGESGILSKNGVVVIEAGNKEVIGDGGGFEIIRKKKYKITTIYILKQIINGSGNI